MHGVPENRLTRAAKVWWGRLRPAMLAGRAENRRYRAQIEPAFDGFMTRVRGKTMTSPQRQYALCLAVRYLVRAGIPGAFVESGVWRGGSSMLTAFTLCHEGETDRNLWLYDTFAGMASPGDIDVNWRGEHARKPWAASRGGGHNSWCYAGIEEVRTNLESTGFPMKNVEFVVGPVEETLPTTAPESIALLRLDTDFYASTRCELEHLFPLLSPGGVLIVDDYGSWRGARRAVDEYFGDRPTCLVPLDASSRLMVKSGVEADPLRSNASRQRLGVA